MADDEGMAALTHILGLLTWVIGPAIIMATTESEFVEENAENALNWQVMVTVYWVAAFILSFLLIGFLLFPVILILDLGFCVYAAIKASDGEEWEYPLTPDIF